MKTIILLLTAGLFTAAIALPTAGATNCDNTPHQDQLLEPQPGTYIYVNPADAARIGLWSESNGRGGLQVDPCRLSGIPIYSADTQMDPLP